MYYTISNPIWYQPKRNFPRADYDKILHHLLGLEWDCEFRGCTSVGEMVNVLYKLLRHIISECISLKIPTNNKYPPWYSREMIQFLREKYKYHVRFKKYKNPVDQVTFEDLRDECKVQYAIKHI